MNSDETVEKLIAQCKSSGEHLVSFERWNLD